jgi:ABC-type branched-subunit amino acid transport system permease subunit
MNATFRLIAGFLCLAGALILAQRSLSLALILGVCGLVNFGLAVAWLVMSRSED